MSDLDVSDPEKPPVVSCCATSLFDGRHWEACPRVSAEEKPMDDLNAIREAMEVKGLAEEQPWPEEKPMDTPMTPEEVKDALWNICYRHGQVGTLHARPGPWTLDVMTLIAQRDALLVAALKEELREKGAQFEGFIGQVKALEEENARLRKSLRMHCGCLE